MGRRQLREHIFKLLFTKMFHEDSEMPEQLQLYFDALGELRGEDQQYMQKKYELICDRMTALDDTISAYSTGWKLSRMNRVDLTILRLAMYEMRYDADIPVKVALNEAVELAKLFGGEDSASFVNGVLGKITRGEGIA